MPPPLMSSGLAPPERDPLERFWRLDHDTRALVTAAACLFILLLGVKGDLSAGVFVLALAPGVLVVRSAVRRHPGAAEDNALARSALAGLLFTLLILEYELVVDFCVSLITAAASADAEELGVAAAVWFSFGQAFLAAAACEEWVKLRLARRALHFERATTPTALLLHAAAASAAFASLENVFYLNFRAADARGRVTLGTLLVRCVLGVPAHIAEGVTSAAGLALHHFGSAGVGGMPPSLTWAALGRCLWPSVLLHGLWDFLLFLGSNLFVVILERCKKVLPDAAPSPAAAPCSSSDYGAFDYFSGADASMLEACADADGRVAALFKSLEALDICVLVSTVVLPLATAYVCRRRVLMVRAMEARPGWTPPPVTPADAEAGAPFGGSSAPDQASSHHAAPAAWSYEAPPAPPPATVVPPRQQRPDEDPLLGL